MVRDSVEEKIAEAANSLMICFLKSVTNRHIRGEEDGPTKNVKKKPRGWRRSEKQPS
jgi:hypothetical protein